MRLRRRLIVMLCRRRCRSSEQIEISGQANQPYEVESMMQLD